MMEQILIDAIVANPKISLVLIRYFNQIGSQESGMIERDYQIQMKLVEEITYT